MKNQLGELGEFKCDLSSKKASKNDFNSSKALQLMYKLFYLRFCDSSDQ